MYGQGSLPTTGSLPRQQQKFTASRAQPEVYSGKNGSFSRGVLADRADDLFANAGPTEQALGFNAQFLGRQVNLRLRRLRWPAHHRGLPQQ